jgi:hypothetical protein
MSLLQKITCIIFSGLLLSIGYFTQRHESLLLIGQFTALFSLYLFLALKPEKLSIPIIIFIAVSFRLIFFLLEPNLSEDVYRFIWDGKMWLAGLNAYEWIPKEMLSLLKENWMEPLFTQLNSPDYYTIYPPANQLLFYIAAFTDSTLLSIIIIRIFIIAAEIGTLLLLPKLLRQYNLPAQNMVWYAFNPLILLELTGNLHFEAFVIFFIVLSLYYFKKSELFRSSLSLGFAIAFKLLPLILIAAYFRKISLQNWIKYGLVSVLVLLLSLIPILFSNALNGILNSSELYFTSFEFNGSIYYLTRAIGYTLKGYNIIAFAGPLMGILSFLGIIILNLFAKKTISLVERMMWTWFIYCLFATTLHPWYCLPLLVLGILSRYKFPVLWTFLIFFTYIGYTSTGFSENLWVTFLEYILLFVFIVIEIQFKVQTKTSVENNITK